MDIWQTWRETRSRGGTSISQYSGSQQQGIQGKCPNVGPSKIQLEDIDIPATGGDCMGDVGRAMEEGLIWNV